MGHYCVTYLDGMALLGCDCRMNISSPINRFKRLPPTVIGLLFHAAEHTMRHVGQLLVTVAVIRNKA